MKQKTLQTILMLILACNIASAQKDTIYEPITELALGKVYAVCTYPFTTNPFLREERAWDFFVVVDRKEGWVKYIHNDDYEDYKACASNKLFVFPRYSILYATETEFIRVVNECKAESN